MNGIRPTTSASSITAGSSSTEVKAWASSPVGTVNSPSTSAPENMAPHRLNRARPMSTTREARKPAQTSADI